MKVHETLGPYPALPQVTPEHPPEHPTTCKGKRSSTHMNFQFAASMGACSTTVASSAIELEAFTPCIVRMHNFSQIRFARALPVQLANTRPLQPIPNVIKLTRTSHRIPAKKYHHQQHQEQVMRIVFFTELIEALESVHAFLLRQWIAGG